MIAPPARSLIGARSPHAWRRAIASAGARPRTLPIRARWLRDFARPFPRLCAGSPFDAALADAVDRLGIRPAHAEPAVGRDRVKPAKPSAKPAKPIANAARRPPVPAGSNVHDATGAPIAVARRRASNAAGATAGTTVTTTSPANGAVPAPRAGPVSRAFLAELAGHAETRSRSGAATNRGDDGVRSAASYRGGLIESGPRTRNRRGGTSAYNGRAGAEVSSTIAGITKTEPCDARLLQPAADATRSLRALLVGRARRAGAAAMLSAVGGIPGGDGGSPAPGALIEQDWSRAPLGPPAPASVLQHAAEAAGSRATAAGTRPHRPPHAEPPRSTTARANAAGDRAAPSRFRLASTGEPRSNTERSDEHAGAAHAGATAFGGSHADAQRGAPSHDETGRAAAALRPTPAPDAESGGAAPAAPVAWPRSAAEPQIAFAAAPAIRCEPAPPRSDDDDLDVLSAQLDRILVTQARRHGIDV